MPTGRRRLASSLRAAEPSSPNEAKALSNNPADNTVPAKGLNRVEWDDVFVYEITDRKERLVGCRRAPRLHVVAASHQATHVIVKRPFAPSARKVVPNRNPQPFPCLGFLSHSLRS